MKKILINESFNEKTIENVTKKQFPNLPKNTFFKALRNKDIKINGKRTNQNNIVHTGDILEIFISDDLLYNNKKINIVYENNDILILNKPKGICTNESTNEPTLLDKAQKELNQKLFPCHRLDRNTSGLIIFAKNEIAYSNIKEKFKNHEIKKYYKCEVIGIPPKKEDTLVGYLEKDSKKSHVYIHDKQVKNSTKIITKYKIISKNLKENTSQLEIELITGKTHQIRAHLAHIGHPIVGDSKYGINSINKKLGKKYQELTAYKIILDNQIFKIE